MVWTPTSVRPDCVEFLLIPTGDDDDVAPLLQLLRQFQADAARAAGDQHRPLCKFHGALLLPVVASLLSVF